MDERTIAVGQVVEEILEHGAYKATRFIYTEERIITVKATLRRYKGKIRKIGNVDIVLTIGKPNYEDRKKIKRAEKAGQGLIEMTAKYPPKAK